MIPGAFPVASVPVAGTVLDTATVAAAVVSDNVLDKSTKDVFWLLEFLFDNEERSLRITNDNDNHSGPNGTYSAAPDIDIKLPGASGFFEEDPLEIKVPKDLAPLFEDLSTAVPHSPVEIFLYELSKDENTSRTKLRFKGHLDKSSIVPQGRSGVLDLKFVNIKTLMDIPMGILATNQCQWRFGKDGCGATVVSESIEVTSISNTRVVQLGTSLVQSNGYYTRGYMEYKGLRILIRNWDGGSVFDLARQPPASWLNQTVTVVGGCDKSIEACRNSQRDREEDFLGLGIVMPDHNPITESS